MGDTNFFCNINKQDGSKEAAVEAKHTPVITVQGAIKAGTPVSVTIDVGEGKHPNEHTHFIQWIDLYANWVFLARVDLSASTVSPKVTLDITLHHGGAQTILRAFAKCNLHGVWEGDKTVTVEK